MSLHPSGYSGTPLPAKLGYGNGMAVPFIALPEAMFGLADVRVAAIDENWSGLEWVIRKDRR
ncbi:hypothetical protein GA830_04325 [Mesorhizobium sp. NBSH29]|uniref:hypothetical protein n=1 Tax=Mesorhizobium sp. NBSH29 TaxID=2654249 RepID=UPI0018965857|nr:hypothetical protein [Mesorhizobium sp. NBSH29]QPC86050.1 hypothetical protein GA830_04325 [Mesorhizobium sp. NBSH29]